MARFVRIIGRGLAILIFLARTFSRTFAFISVLYDGVENSFEAVAGITVVSFTTRVVGQRIGSLTN